MKNVTKLVKVLVIMNSVLIGMMAGVVIERDRNESENTKLLIEIEDKNEIIYQMQGEIDRLDCIINDYTIEERKMD